MAVQVTKATTRLLELKKRIRAVSGGTGASKTFSIVMILIDYSQTNRDEKVDIVSESFPHLEAGVIQDFKTVMKDRDYWKDDRWNETKHIYNFETGTTIKFLSVDKIGKAHGPRRDVLFLNECNFMNYDIADQLITRTRKIVWLDWNPSEDFWFYEQFLNQRNDIDFVGENGQYPPLTYKDNEALSKQEVLEIEAHKNNVNWFRVYGFGLRGIIEGRIYKDWKIINDIPHEARLERYGLDFGYSNDPSALVAIYYYNGGYILDEIFFQKELSNKNIADILANKEKVLVIADSAEPKSIDEISDYGINIIGAEKGKDSVKYGIQTVQAQQISVTSRSTHVIKEYRNYLWKTDKDGKILNEPEHAFSHSMDSVRYGIMSLVPIQRRNEFIRARNMTWFRKQNKGNPAE